MVVFRGYGGIGVLTDVVRPHVYRGTSSTVHHRGIRNRMPAPQLAAMIVIFYLNIMGCICNACRAA